MGAFSLLAFLFCGKKEMRKSKKEIAGQARNDEVKEANSIFQSHKNKTIVAHHPEKRD